MRPPPISRVCNSISTKRRSAIHHYQQRRRRRYTATSGRFLFRANRRGLRAVARRCGRSDEQHQLSGRLFPDAVSRASGGGRLTRRTVLEPRRRAGRVTDSNEPPCGSTSVSLPRPTRCVSDN
uniref:Uncharacterized protein n=1 Tax=Plectus sambesii TaxID=2011161 RepID=A0A914XP33_9BILA